jgi:hypothetical protein
MALSLSAETGMSAVLAGETEADDEALHAKRHLTEFGGSPIT